MLLDIKAKHEKKSAAEFLISDETAERIIKNNYNIKSSFHDHSIQQFAQTIIMHPPREPDVVDISNFEKEKSKVHARFLMSKSYRELERLNDEIDVLLEKQPKDIELKELKRRLKEATLFEDRLMRMKSKRSKYGKVYSGIDGSPSSSYRTRPVGRLRKVFRLLTLPVTLPFFILILPYVLIDENELFQMPLLNKAVAILATLLWIIILGFVVLGLWYLISWIF